MRGAGRFRGPPTLEHRSRDVKDTTSPAETRLAAPVQRCSHRPSEQRRCTVTPHASLVRGRRPPSRPSPGAVAVTVLGVTALEAPAPLPREAMTARQLARRARLLEAVVEIVTEVGPHALQMREVAERSGVALGTAYKYFRSREQLLASALAEWQQPLMARMASVSRSRETDTATLVSAYLRRALRAFHRNPHMGALMVLMQTSADPDVVETVAEMGTRSSELMEQMLVGLPPATLPHVGRGLDAVLMNAVTALVTGRASLDEAVERVEGVARLLLAGATAP